VEAEKGKKTWMVCFWVSAAIVLFVFMIPVQSIESGAVYRSYTLWDLISGNGPSTVEVRIRTTGNDPYPP